MNKKIYIVTENLEHFFKLEKARIAEFRLWLRSLLINCLGDNINLVKVSYNDILDFFTSQLPDDVFVISLDNGIYSTFLQNSIFQFNITRFYDITKWEIAILKSEATHCKRDWWNIASQIPELINAIKKSSKTRIWLLDDWKFSWWTIKTTIKLLQQNKINPEICLLWINVWADELIEWVPILSFYNIDKKIYAWWMLENDFTNFWWASISWGNVPYIISAQMIESRLKIRGNPQLFYNKIRKLINETLEDKKIDQI